MAESVARLASSAPQIKQTFVYIFYSDHNRKCQGVLGGEEQDHPPFH